MASQEKKLKTNSETFQSRILDWYDRHRRALPWRALPGRMADPYHVWLSEIMLQQTTVGAVIPYFTKFLAKWPKLQDLAAADQEEVMQAWAGLGYYARARNLHACAKLLAEQGFPSDRAALKKLPGIGDYTSAAIASIVFNQPASLVDANVERVMARYFAVEDPLPKSKPILKSLAAELATTDRPGDYGQGLMDLGATICRPKSPKCALCPVNEGCQGFAAGFADDLPRREKKGLKPQKTGHVYWIENEPGQILIHKRPERGMLGGMTGLPTSEWLKGKSEPKHLDFLAVQTTFSETVRHSFTHFDLQLILHNSQLRNKDRLPSGYSWAEKKSLMQMGFPTLFKKAYHLFEPQG